MLLIVHKLKTDSLYQDITTPKKCLIAAIRPHLYLYGNPSGSLQLQVLDQNNELVAESETLTISEIYSGVGSLGYYHGYVRFYVNLYAQADTIYRIKLVSSGYTYADNDHVGWCNDFDQRKYTLDYTPTNEYEYPLDLEVWVRNP